MIEPKSTTTNLSYSVKPIKNRLKMAIKATQQTE
jgi:hypothetical protein